MGVATMHRGFKHFAFGFAVAAAIAGGANFVQAETEVNLPNALDYAGFDLIGQRNPLSGGIDFLATSEFDGVPFDFGTWELSLSGPLSVQVSTGGRLLNQFDFSLTTAVNGRSDASPLSYLLSHDLGGQTAQIAGNVLADVDFSINKFGFYDLEVAYSSRQDTATQGRFSNDTTSNDADFGPLHLSGNIYADALAILTDPIFDRTGTPNLFASFSDNQVLNNMLTGSMATPDELLASAAGLDSPAAKAIHTIYKQGGIPGPPDSPPGQDKKGGAVPEPAVLVLMLLGLPAILAYPRRRRR